MLITEQFEETRSFLMEGRRESRRTILVPLRWPLHEGKLELVRRAAGHGDLIAVALLGGRGRAVREQFAGMRVDVCYLGEERSGHPEEAFMSLSDGDILAGEKDFYRLRRLEERLKTEGRNVVRAGIVRDVDSLPFSGPSQVLSAEERFFARYIPLSLEKAVKMVEGGERRAPLLLEQTLENLGKSQGLEVRSVTLVSSEHCDPRTGDPAALGAAVVPGARLCITAAAGAHELKDNRELLRTDN